MSITLSPALFALLITFCAEVTAAVTMCTLAISRTPHMPTGCLIPSWPSSSYSCGITWMTSRSAGMAIAWACSITRFRSAGRTSRSLIAIMPISLCAWMWPPAIPAYTELISQPAIISASSTALRIESTVASMSTTTPLRSPRDGCVPIPITSIESPAGSATTAQILVVPTSRPTISSSCFAILTTPRCSLETAQHRIAPETQIDFLGALGLDQVAVGELPPVGERRRRVAAHHQQHRAAERAHAHLAAAARVHARQIQPCLARRGDHRQRGARVTGEERQPRHLVRERREALARRVEREPALRLERHRHALDQADHEAVGRQPHGAHAGDAR